MGKRTAQKDTIIDTTSDSQVYSNFPHNLKKAEFPNILIRMSISNVMLRWAELESFLIISGPGCFHMTLCEICTLKMALLLLEIADFRKGSKIIDSFSSWYLFDGRCFSKKITGKMLWLNIGKNVYLVYIEFMPSNTSKHYFRLLGNYATLLALLLLGSNVVTHVTSVA